MIISLRSLAPFLTLGAAALAPHVSAGRLMAQPIMAAAQSPALRGEWRVEAIGGRPLAEPAQASLHFDNGGRVSGRAVCNRFTASYEAKGDALTISRAASTRMACPPPLMELEALFLDILNATARYSVSNGALALHARDGRTIVARRPA